MLRVSERGSNSYAKAVAATNHKQRAKIAPASKAIRVEAIFQRKLSNLSAENAGGVDAASTAGLETGATSAKRLRRMHDELLRAYGPQHWWPAKTPFEVILGAYLTQNTAWKAVERSLENLRAAGALTVDGLRAIPMAKLRRLIRPSGFIVRKAPALKAFVKMLDEEFGGSLEAMEAVPTGNLRERLLELPGVGNETADAILLYALGHAVPVADEYLRRDRGAASAG